MNIQRKNSAHHFRKQSEREQTLVIMISHQLYICMICGETVHQGDCIFTTTEELMTFTTCGEVSSKHGIHTPRT